MPDKDIKTLEQERNKFRDEANDVKDILESLISGLEKFITFFRVLLYGGSVAGAWFYLKDHALAIAIVSSLTAAHGLMEFKDWLRSKKEKLTKRSYL